MALAINYAGHIQTAVRHLPTRYTLGGIEYDGVGGDVEDGEKFEDAGVEQIADGMLWQSSNIHAPPALHAPLEMGGRKYRVGRITIDPDGVGFRMLLVNTRR